VRGLETTELDLAFVISQELMGIHHCVSRKKTNLTNASSRSVESFFSVSNEKVDGGEAVQKKRKEAELVGEVENEMKKITHYFYRIHSDCSVRYYRRFGKYFMAECYS